MSPRSDPPVPIMTVLDAAVAAVLGGSHGWLTIPAGGYLNVIWLARKEWYRVTIDVTTAGGLLPAATVDDFNAETRRKLAELLEETPDAHELPTVSEGGPMREVDS